jgi:hypothetical protein
MQTKKFLHRGPLSTIERMVTALVILLTLSPADRAIAPHVAAAAVREAAALWAPYGVVVAVATTNAVIEHAGEPRQHLLVDLARVGAPRHARAEEPLGAIDFDDGIPASLVRVFVTALVDLLDRSERYGVGFDRWPIAAQYVFLARALGRVIAHEIGHYLLGPQHTAGLMRISFAPRDLVDPSGKAFRLSTADVERLKACYPRNSQEAKLR